MSPKVSEIDTLKEEINILTKRVIGCEMELSNINDVLTELLMMSGLTIEKPEMDS